MGDSLLSGLDAAEASPIGGFSAVGPPVGTAKGICKRYRNYIVPQPGVGHGFQCFAYGLEGIFDGHRACCRHEELLLEPRKIREHLLKHIDEVVEVVFRVIDGGLQGPFPDYESVCFFVSAITHGDSVQLGESRRLFVSSSDTDVTTGLRGSSLAAEVIARRAKQLAKKEAIARGSTLSMERLLAQIQVLFPGEFEELGRVRADPTGKFPLILEKIRVGALLKKKGKTPAPNARDGSVSSLSASFGSAAPLGSGDGAGRKRRSDGSVVSNALLLEKLQLLEQANDEKMRKLEDRLDAALKESEKARAELAQQVKLAHDDAKAALVKAIHTEEALFQVQTKFFSLFLVSVDVLGQLFLSHGVEDDGSGGKVKVLSDCARVPAIVVQRLATFLRGAGVDTSIKSCYWCSRGDLAFQGLFSCSFGGLGGSTFTNAVGLCFSDTLPPECVAFLEELRPLVGNAIIEDFVILLARATLTLAEIIMDIVRRGGVHSRTVVRFPGKAGTFFAGFDCSASPVQYYGMVGRK